MKGKILLNRKVIAAATASLLSAGLLTVLPAASSSASSPPLIMESSPENTITQDFNPFVPTAAPQGMGATGLIYEPLIQFDLAAPPKYYPWLATKFAWSNGGKSITFTIRNGVKWNDGTPFTARTWFSPSTGQEERHHQPVGPEHLERDQLGQHGHRELPDGPVHQPGEHRRHGHSSPARLGQRR